MPARFLPDAQSHRTQKAGWHVGCLFPLCTIKTTVNQIHTVINEKLLKLDKNGKIYGLIFGCPFMDCAVDCPFIEIRKLSLQERIEYIEKLTAEQVNQLVETHNIRFHDRELRNKKIDLCKPEQV